MSLRLVLLALLFANLLFLALTGWPGVLGALVRLVRHPRLAAARPNGTSRTAVLFPVYNEDPHAVFTAAEVMAQALIEQAVDQTDIFVLSDTRDPAIAAAEEQAFARLQRMFGNRVRYRRRTLNLRRKAGNIADFCAAWSGEYDYMVVLDADSLMGAGTISMLIGLMDANPRAGLMQTVPYAVGRETLFARIQQFAARLYTPLLVEGLAFWQGQDGQLLGPQRDHPHRAVHAALRAAGAAGPRAVRRRDPVPRRGGGGDDAAWRLAGAAVADAARELRGAAGQHGGFRPAGAPLVPGQPAASRRAADARACVRWGGITWAWAC